MRRRNRSVLVTLLIASALFAAEDGYRTQIEKFRRDSDLFMRSPGSPLLLVGRYTVKEGTSTLGSDPGSTMLFPPTTPRHVGVIVRHGSQCVFQPAADISATFGDKPISEPVRLQVNGTGSPIERVGFGEFTFALRLLNNEVYLFLGDFQSPFLKAFAGRTWFPIDPRYEVVAQFVPTAQQKSVRIRFTDGGERAATVMGDLVFQLAGHDVRVPAIASSDGKRLFIMFQDQTSGKETYDGGRTLEVDSPANGKVTLDFNRALNPYCAYNPHAVCPMPITDDRLAIPIRAGETFHQPVGAVH